jgi:hypothetical protein
MARPSKIDRLPLQIRDKVRTLREAGRTIDEIYEKLGELDVDVSRSSVGRHIQNLDKILEMTRESRKAAEMICERIGENPDNRVARANIEILHAQIMRLNTATETGEAVRFDPQEVYFLSKALHSLTSASKVDLDRDTKLLERIREEAREKAAAAVDTALAETSRSGGPGLSADLVEAIKKQILFG